MAYAPLPQADFDHIMHFAEPCWPSLQGAHLFVTGGTGFIGRWIIESLLEANNRFQLNMHLTLLTRNINILASRWPAVIDNPSLTLIEGDVRNFSFPSATATHIIAGATDASADLLINNPILMQDIIVRGTEHTLKFAADCPSPKVLFLSSGGVYGKPPDSEQYLSESYLGAPITEDPWSAYGLGKRLAENQAFLYANKYGFEAKVARCFSMVGPLLPINTHFAIGNFIRDALSQRPIGIQGTGEAVRSYLYAADMVIWLLHVLVFGKPNHPYNIGSQHPISILELAQKVAQLCGYSTEIDIQNGGSTASNRLVPSVERISQELGMNEWIGIDDAILRTINWYLPIVTSQKDLAP